MYQLLLLLLKVVVLIPCNMKCDFYLSHSKFPILHCVQPLSHSSSSFIYILLKNQHDVSHVTVIDNYW